MNRFMRLVTFALSAGMCFMGFGMLFGLASFWLNSSPQTLVRFLPVALFPFAWAAFVLFLTRKNRGQSLMAVLTVIVFVGFIGAIDFANGRPVYSGLSYLR